MLRPRSGPRSAALLVVVVLIPLLLGGLAPPAAAATASTVSSSPPFFGNWSGTNFTNGPGNVSEFGFAWVDASPHGYGVLFGGRTGLSTYSNRTYLYESGKWLPLPTRVQPSARRGPMMTYDAKDGYVLLFGGSNATNYLNDTWEFGHGHWTLLNPTVAPPARRVGTMAYDPAAGFTLLFGGHNGYVNLSYIPLSDTWKFVAGQWTELFPATVPSARMEASMAFDRTAGIMVLFGGYTSSAPSYVALNDTWYWRWGNWHPLNLTTSPSERDGAPMAFDPRTGAIVLFGGHYDSQNASARDFNDTWALSGATPATLRWSLVATARAPPGADAGNMIFDPSQGRLVLFGGRSGYPTTTWYSETWTLLVR